MGLFSSSSILAFALRWHRRLAVFGVQYPDVGELFYSIQK